MIYPDSLKNKKNGLMKNRKRTIPKRYNKPSLMIAAKKRKWIPLPKK